MHKTCMQAYLKRASLFFIFALIVFGLVIARLVYLQIIRHNYYSQLQDKQANVTIDIQPETGMILDRNGKPLAMSRMVNSVYVVPQDLENKPAEIQKIASVLSIGAGDLYAKINKAIVQKRYFLWVKRRIDDDAAKKLEDLKIKGVGFNKEYKRFYPKTTTAAHLIGYRGLDERPLEGAELAFDKYLKGEVGSQTLNRDAKRHLFTSELPDKPAVPGHNVFLTIDVVIQHIVENNLNDLCQKWKPTGVQALVLRPYTGEVLAMAQMPSFDPTNYQKYPAELRRNRFVTEAYEPGSTFKPFVVSAALEKGIFTPRSMFFCENGTFKVGKRTITDHEPYGNLSLTDVVAHSSNIGMAKIGLATGKESMYAIVKRFGFGGYCGLGIGTEHPGLITRPGKWSYYTLTSVPMGYEISVNTVQLARAYAVFANGGAMVNPQIIREVEDRAGNEIYKNPALFEPMQAKMVISPEINEQMRAILRQVVVSGTGAGANLKTYALAGKTGTARKIGPDKRYSTQKYRSLFACFAPLEKPEIVVLIVVDEPKGAYYASTVAAPTASRIVEDTLRYLNVSSRIVNTPAPTGRRTAR